ncbi:alpha/beta fold hydrolase [Flavobacteriaceae bacterium M23B6Z8]
MVLAYKGIEIFYSDTGTGEPVVFLHGFLENSTMWEDLVPSIESQRRVICIDLLGHGETGNLGYIHTMEMMAEAVLEVLDHLTVKRAIFIGHSMGGYVCLALAEKAAYRIQKLVLMNSTWHEDTAERKINRDRAIDAVKKNQRAFIKITIPNLFSETGRLHHQKKVAAVTKAALKTSLRGVIAALEGMKSRKNQIKTVRAIAKETYVIVGKQDGMIDYQQILSEAENMGVNVLLLDGGHMSHIENRTKVLLFLAEIVHK